MNNMINIFQKDITVESPKLQTTNSGWISFGERNTFPSDLQKMVQESPIQKAILDGKLTYALGSGLVKPKEFKQLPNPSYGWDEMLYRCMSDYILYEAFAVQVILNNDKRTFSVYHTPCDQVRLGKYNSNNVIEKAYLCSDWSKARRNNVVEVDMFGATKVEIGKPYLMYIKPYKPNEYYYSIPSYFSCVNYMLADAALAKYYSNYISNNFAANMVIKFPYELDDERKDELYSILRKSFSGSHNAGNFLMLFGENGTMPTIEPLESANADLYQNVCDTVLKYIVSANRLTSPLLVGLATSSGFSSKSDEIIAAYSLYKITVIQEIRNFVLGKLNDLVQMNGAERWLTIQDMDLRSEFEGDTEENDEVEDDAIGVASQDDDEEESNEVEAPIEETPNDTNNEEKEVDNE